MPRHRMPNFEPGGMYGPSQEEPITFAQLRELVKDRRNIPRLLEQIQAEVCDYLKGYEATVTVSDASAPGGISTQTVRSDQPPKFELPENADYRAQIAADIARQCQVFLPILRGLPDHACLYRDGIILGRLMERFQVLVFDDLVRKHRRLGKGSGEARTLAARERYQDLYALFRERRDKAANSKRSDSDIFREVAASRGISVSKLRRAVQTVEDAEKKVANRKKKAK